MDIKNHISRVITVYVSGNKCNLNCSYCYVTNTGYQGELEKVNLKYDLDTMIKAFSISRLGGWLI